MNVPIHLLLQWAPHCLRRADVLRNPKHGVLFRRRHQTRRGRRSGP